MENARQEKNVLRNLSNIYHRLQVLQVRLRHPNRLHNWALAFVLFTTKNFARWHSFVAVRRDGEVPQTDQEDVYDGHTRLRNGPNLKA